MSQEICTQDQAMLSALLGVKKQVPDTNQGICGCVDEELSSMRNESDDMVEKRTIDNTFWGSGRLLSPAFKTWPHYSGSNTYPVPSTTKSFNRCDAYDALKKWDRRTQYGKLRWELLDHCIEYFQQQVNQANQIQGDHHASS